MEWLKRAFRRVTGTKGSSSYAPFSEPDWENYDGNPYRVIYILRMKEGVKKSELYEFLIGEWLPALKGARGCIGVEIVDDFAPGSGYTLLELWETRKVHDEEIPKLWYGTHRHIFDRLKEVGEFVFLWEGIILREIKGKEVI